MNKSQVNQVIVITVSTVLAGMALDYMRRKKQQTIMPPVAESNNNNWWEIF